MKKILSTGWLNNTISCEVEELLAKPERDFIRDIQYLTDCLMESEEKVSKLLDKPEQEHVVGMYRDIFEDYKYIINAFENGVDANDYSREIQQAKSDIRKACNWLYPLPTDVIDDLTIKSFYAGTFDFRVYAREIEKQHGIGADDE